MRHTARARDALIPLLLIAVATVIAYSNAFHASFHFDDLSSIVQNQSLRDLRTQWPPSGSRYLGYLSFALNYRLGGLEVFGYHLANVLIHVGNALLVYWLTAITLKTPALRQAEAGPLVRRYLPLFAALLFALHPLATQAVTYIVQRFASLATLFFLLSLALYALARLKLEADPPSRARVPWLFCLSVLAAAAAMKTKEISFTLPVVAAGYELLFFRCRRRLLLLAPLAATAMLVPLGRLAGHGPAGGLDELGRFAAETPEIPRSVYLLTQARVVVTYLRLLLLPVGQNLDYDFGLSHSLADPSVLLALAVLSGVAAFAAFLLLRALETNRITGTLVFFGVAWFFVTLSVESSFIPIRDVIFEHRVYLPSAGAAVALGAALLWAVERLRLRVSLPLQAGVALLITAGPLGVATYSRNFVWKDDLTLWSDVVAKSPHKARPHCNLGVAHLDRGATSDAIAELLAALEIVPEYPEALINLGDAYMRQGRVDEAIAVLGKAIALAPAHPQAHNTLGDAYRAKGRLDDAVREYRDAIHSAEVARRTADLAAGHLDLGVAYAAKGQLADAVREYGEAIHFASLAGRATDVALAHNDLGTAYATEGQLDDAGREYREAIRIEPTLAEPHSNLGSMLAKQGRVAEAVEEHRRALELKPMPEIAFNLAVVLEAAGRGPEAIAYYQRFLDEAGHKYPDRAERARGSIVRLRASTEGNAR